MSKELNTNDFILADWKLVDEELIKEAIIKEGKPTIANVLGIKIEAFYDWFKVRKIKTPIVRNFNYYNSRKPESERLPYEDVLSKKILEEMIHIRDKRLHDQEIIERTCPTCGKVFEVKKGSTQKYCSSECVCNRVRSEEEKERISESCIGRVAWNKGKKSSPESVAKFRESIKEVWTIEKRKEQSELQRRIWKDNNLLEKHSEKMREILSSEDTRNKIAKSVHEYNMTISDEEWKERYLKSFNTKSENGSLYVSKGEIEITEFVKSLGFDVSKYAIGKDNNRFEIDIYVEEKKIGIEYNGVYYHSTNGINHRSRKYHFNKSTIADDYGIELIHVWEDQWKNQKEIIKDIIAARLGVIRGEKIYARKCEIRDVSTAEYRKFCMDNHVQGYRSASVKLGLYYNDKLVQIASFNKARQYSISTANTYEWEWVRGCISSNNKVIGGTSKLFKHFIDTYDPENILCFSDWNLFSGKGYEESGFELVGFTGPDKFYITSSNRLDRINRNPYSYKMYKKLVETGKLFECYGCGSKKFVWYNSNKIQL